MRMQGIAPASRPQHPGDHQNSTTDLAEGDHRSVSRVQCHVLVGGMLNSKSDLILGDASVGVFYEEMPAVVVVPTNTARSHP